MNDCEWSLRDVQMVTKDGNIRHYLNDDRIEEFNVGDCADLSFPSGYGHCRRVYKGIVPALACASIRRLIVKVKQKK